MDASKVKISNETIKVGVTAVKFIDDKLLAGMGSDFLVFTLSEHSFTLPYIKEKVHYNANIHGICPNLDASLIVLFGGKVITIVALKLEDSLLKITVEKSWIVKDWIMDAHWTNEKSLLTMITAHNVLSVWNWKDVVEINTAVCKENCILYSAQLLGNSWDDSVILCGTVFREIVIWTTHGDKNTSRPVLHRLQGHKGVVFSVKYDEKSERISSTSDDRTVRVWSVNFKPGGSDTLEKWTSASFQLLFTIFGHVSRVWCSKILSNRKIISIGEDSLLCMWNEEGHCIWQQESHQGSGVWSMDCNEELKLIATGGADGGISLWPLDFPDLVPHILPPPSDIPRKLALLTRGRILAITEQGYVTINSNGLWNVSHIDERFARYCLLELSFCRKFAAFATIYGDVVIAEVNNKIGTIEKIIDMQAVNGRIFSMHWLKDYHLILCGPSGALSLWKLNLDKESELKKIAELTLPHCKERWVTSALLLDSTLICGDRDGSVHCYNLKNDMSKQIVVSQTLRRIHGRLGVSSLKWLDKRVWSAGRDGTLRQFTLVNNKLCCVSVDRLSMEWVADLIECPQFGVLVLGFHAVSCLIWSVRERRTLVQKNCGGGHRSWACSLENGKLYFAFLKDKTAHMLCCTLRDINCPSLLQGHHVREINSLVKLPVETNRGIWLASGGEDTTVRITRFEQNQFNCESVVQSHLSSVRVVKAVICDANSTLMFTAGGRAQIKVWRVHLDSSATPPVLSSVEVASEMLQEEKPSRPWWKVKPRNTAETRYMDLDVVHYSEGSLLVLVASSDTYLRVFNFTTATNKLEFKLSLWYSYNCLLKVGSLRWKEDMVAFSAATDGKLVFWNLSNIETVNEPFSVLPLHQSGINACDWCNLSSDSVLFATGGDDASLSLCCIQTIVSPSLEAKIHSKWTDNFSHCSQITGVKITKDYIISAGVDQRINIMQWTFEGVLKISKVAQYISSVSDIHGVEVWPQGTDLAVCVFGAGFQVVNFDFTRTSNKDNS